VNLPSFAIVTGPVVRDVLRADLSGCLETVRTAYLEHHRGKTVNPPSAFLRFPDRPDARIIALPAASNGAQHVSGIKWIASYPANIAHGLARASAVLLLNDAETGYPFACLEASLISAARTAASAALAAQTLLGERKARRLGIVGGGVIARAVWSFLEGLGWEIDEILVFDTDSARAATFVAELGRTDSARTVTSVGACVRASDLVLFTTTAGTPYLIDPELVAHRPVVLHLSLRDLGPEVILAAQNVVDDVEHVMTARTSVDLTAQREGNRSFITGTLAEIIAGERAVTRDRATVFSPFGLGMLDLAVGNWVYQRACDAGALVDIPEFFAAQSLR
jgi:N-[(2S)-2-amino-2-carboxyethyl]-L-glutamate dehydrogenase